VSGFIAVLHRDGRPVDPAQLAALTDALAFRGPDGRARWQRGPVGLGHARLVTHAQRDGEPQPLALDGRYRLAGDIRLDAREDLIASLCHSERSEESRGASDAALVLRAFRAWGPACLERLHGDFSFALWDEPEQRLFCARDRFGVRPLFHAALGDLVLVGNTLGALRAHPRVGASLDELALADYLACGFSLDPAASFWRDVRRLPAAHCLEASSAGVRIQRYWTLPEQPELRLKHAGDYVEQLGELLSRAVADRAGGDTAGLSLSGGLDSAAIGAALAGRLGRGPAHPARAFCSGWNCAFPDPEPQAAARTAAALDLPLEILEAADCRPLAPDAAWVEPEPSGDLFPAQFIASLARMARDTRVNLDGQGGDEIFSGETLLGEATRAPLPRLALDALRTWTAVRRPPLGLRARRAPQALPQLPDYLAAGWRDRLALPDRLRAAESLDVAPGRRPSARARLARRIWGPYLEGFDPGFTGVAIQTRWPFLDERVVRFALSLPPLPWCVDKHLLRRALAPLLPAEITARPKRPLAGDPLERFLARTPDWIAHAMADVGLGDRVDVAAWRQAWSAAHGSGAPWPLMRPVALAQWLRRNATSLPPFSPPPAAALPWATREAALAQVSHGTH
jgi:asparagine synthase (glutamine-hydrolysing)